MKQIETATKNGWAGVLLAVGVAMAGCSNTSRQDAKEVAMTAPSLKEDASAPPVKVESKEVISISYIQSGGAKPRMLGWILTAAEPEKPAAADMRRQVDIYRVPAMKYKEIAAQVEELLEMEKRIPAGTRANPDAFDYRLVVSFKDGTRVMTHSGDGLPGTNTGKFKKLTEEIKAAVLARGGAAMPYPDTQPAPGAGVGTAEDDKVQAKGVVSIMYARSGGLAGETHGWMLIAAESVTPPKFNAFKDHVEVYRVPPLSFKEIEAKAGALLEIQNKVQPGSRHIPDAFGYYMTIVFSDGSQVTYHVSEAQAGSEPWKFTKVAQEIKADVLARGEGKKE